MTLLDLYRFKGPLIMGVVNVTPDSFSDGGRFIGFEAALNHAQSLITDGADVLDIGGESTRPGAHPVTLAEEIDRVVPLIAALSQITDVPISIDTLKPEVAEEAFKAGADIWNDVSAQPGGRRAQSPRHHPHAYAGRTAYHAGQPLLRRRGG